MQSYLHAVSACIFSSFFAHDWPVLVFHMCSCALSDLRPDVVLLSMRPANFRFYTVHLDRAPYTNRIRMIDLSRQKELSMGEQNYRHLLASHRVLPAQHAASQLVQKVGTRIAATANLEGVHWEFSVLDSPVINAACLPGGKVVVFRGLLELFEYDEAALAVVLAHEAGHVVARHAAEQLGFLKVLLWLEFGINIIYNARSSRF